MSDKGNLLDGAEFPPSMQDGHQRRTGEDGDQFQKVGAAVPRLMRRRMLGELANRAADPPRDSGVDPAEVRELVASYEQALPDLRASIGEFAKAQQQARQQEERARYRPALLGMIAAVAGGGFLLVWRRRAGRAV